MALNKFEKKQLAQINRINEGLGSSVLNLLFRGKFKKQLKKAAKTLDENPELKSLLADFYRNAENIEDEIKRAAAEEKALYRANRKKSKK